MAADYSERMPCPLCVEPAGALYQDDRVMVTLHEDRAVRGHAMVIWRNHVENVSDLTDAEAAHLMRVYRAAERALLESTGAERAVILKLGIQTPHLHLHIYPVGASLDRAAVMEIVDARVRDPMSEADAAAFSARVRALLTESAE